MKSSSIPYTTQNNPRYSVVSASSNGSQFNHHHQSFNKSLSLNANQSFNTSYNNNSSILYSNKSKKIQSKNSWSHPFSIPIEVGNPNAVNENPELQLWCSNVHVIRLRTNNRRINCGGLQWDIYIHPNQGENGQEYSLSVFPVKNNVNDKLPPNYKLQYTVKTSLNTNKNGGDRNNDDEKSMNKFDHEWIREINEIIYDANPGDIAGSSKSQIEWKSHMERLSFNKRDLYQCGLDDDYFNLYISIQTKFIRKPTKRSTYHGVLGAILLQSEQELDQNKKQIDKLNNKKDELVMTLQNQLNQANRLNTEYSTNYTKSTEMHKQYLEQIESLGNKIQDLIQRDEQRAKQNERKIGNLTSDIQMKDAEISRLKMSLHQYKTELIQQNQIAGYYKAFQQQQPAQVPSNVIQSQQHLEQERRLAQQRFIQQNQQRQQAQIQVTNPFQGNMNNNNQSSSSVQQQQPQQQQVINNNLPPQTHISSNYSSFPGNSPQKNVTTRSTLIIDNSPQTTVSNQSQQSPQQSYKAKVVQQPDFNSFRQQQAINPNASTSPQKNDPNQSFNRSQLPFAPQSPQQISLNDTSFNNNNNVPPLEKQEFKQAQQEESKSQAVNVNEPTPISNTGNSATPNTNNMSQKTASQSPIKNLSQNDKQDVQSPEPVATTIDENMDENDEVEFQHRPARAWRWDKEQQKWRGRGKGQLSIYYNKSKGLAKIVFTDEKHDKTRLLQWIDGKSHAEFSEDETNSNNHPTKTNLENVEWFGSDYTMDPIHPMEGNWKLAFMDNPTAAQQFVDLFNGHIDAVNGNVNNNNDDNNDNNNVPNANDVSQEVSTTAPIDDEEDNKSNDSTKPFANTGLGDIDPNKPFTFDIKDEKPKDSFTDNPSDFASKKNQWSFDTNISANGNEETSNSFGNIDWGLGFNTTSMLSGQTNEEKVQDNKPEDNNNKVDNNNDKKASNDEDNGIECTFQPIANLEEQKVDSGHENEILIKELKFIKLYRFGKDVAGVPGWKNRASSSKICFFKSKETGKVRMIAREHETNKLRMNQNVPIPSSSKFSMRSAKVCQWMANDLSIATEEEDESAGVSQWCIKFDSSDKADEFKKVFEESSNCNASVTSPIKPQKPVQDQPATPQQLTSPQQPASPQQTNVQQNDESEMMNTTLMFQDVNEQTDKVEDKMESKPEDDKYAGMTEEEIAANKAREEKRKEAEAASKLFGGGDDANKVSWNADVFGQKFENNNDNTFQFSEEQRGVDLDVERQINKIGTDPSISFGVTGDNETGQGQDFSNVTTRDANNNDNDSQQEKKDESTSGWNSNFNFNVDAGTEKQDDNPQANEDEVTKESGSGWNIGGGFSGVTTTDGFDNASWGNDNENSGFGTFGDSNNEFNFAALGKGAEDGKNESKPAENENDKNDDNNNNDNKDDDDNGGEMTFKPIVKLNEVDVQSGHENEKLLKSFQVSKVYRWGKDVSGVPGWKNRASSTEIKFYQSLKTGCIRIVCRENITNKLRLNQSINGKIAKLEKKGEKQIGWSANDMTIAAEEEDETKGFCPFAAKFKDAETCQAFFELFTSAADNNMQINSSSES